MPLISITIEGATKTGKTSLAAKIGRYLAKQGHYVVMSSEMIMVPNNRKIEPKHVLIEEKSSK